MGGQSPQWIDAYEQVVGLMVVSGRTVAILHDSIKDSMNVTTWDITGHQSHHFPIL